MTFRNKMLVLWTKITPPGAPTDLAEAFDGLKRSFWKAAAPAAMAKEKIMRTYMEREIADLNDVIDELESRDEGTEIDMLRDTNLAFRKTIDILQPRVADLEVENEALREKLNG